ncbi:UvrD-helicase domain-containing protein [Lentibacillus cibarius]|uniref:UvrD-helicase domain-containing protein n=1 Tax=Lentibacillus cibarius TaxID=2583219 RepID=UPI0014862C63|nr:UvrD-helicase domain-containing protein [Lentibacillus cibarius]
MTTTTIDRKKEIEAFGRRLSRRWKNYFSLEGLLPGIVPTNEQKQVVQSNEKQLVIRGSAGSGKSLMLVYRLIKLMEQEESRQKILYVTFNQTLTQDTRKRLNQSDKYRELSQTHDVEVITYHDLVRNILMYECGYPNINRLQMKQSSITEHESFIESKIMTILDQFKHSSEYEKYEKLFKTHSAKFLREEFFWMKANGINTWDQYSIKERKGRGHSPNVAKRQRPTIFHLFDLYQEFMKTNFKTPQLDMEDYALHLLNELQLNPNASFKYDHILVDEFQDLQPMQIKSLVKLAKKSITLVGDAKQRIYKRTPVSYKDLNLKVNSRTNQRLTKNFRSTKQIMNLASALQFTDVENVREDDQNFFREGPKPEIKHFTTMKRLASQMKKEINQLQTNHPGKSIAVIHRYNDNEVKQYGNLRHALERDFHVIGIEQYGKSFNYNKEKKPIFFTNPFEIKGLEFDFVFIVHFDRMHYPSSERINDLKKRYDTKKINYQNYDKDYDDILNDEKKVLYVANSRAKEELKIFYAAEKQIRISPFVNDFDTRDYVSNFSKSKYKNN